MIINRLQKRKRLNVLGLNSGTSIDSIDMALVRVESDKCKFICGKGKKYPRTLQSLIMETADSKNINLDKLVHLDNMLGRFIGLAAKIYIEQLIDSGKKVDLIGSHGQTVRHLPQKVALGRSAVNGSLQIGSLNQIASMTGLLTIGDFRQGEIAIGGEGAPITGGALERLLGKKDQSRLVVNIGGMSNYFYYPFKSTQIRKADCGPGNSISDLLMRKFTGKEYDNNGAFASKGQISARLLTLLQSNSFFKSRINSTGREAFGAKLAGEIIDFGSKFKLSQNDMMATAVELTAVSIARSVKPILKKDPKLTKFYLTGGGRKNRFMVERIKNNLTDVTVGTVEELKLDGDYLEAACFAVMADNCLRGLPNTKEESAVNGLIAQPPRRL